MVPGGAEAHIAQDGTAVEDKHREITHLMSGPGLAGRLRWIVRRAGRPAAR